MKIDPKYRKGDRLTYKKPMKRGTFQVRVTSVFPGEEKLDKIFYNIYNMDTNRYEYGIFEIYLSKELKHIREEKIKIFSRIFVIGGGEIYQQLIKVADEIELTLVDKDFEGDAFFPEVGDEWIEASRETSNNGEFDYHFIKYVRK